MIEPCISGLHHCVIIFLTEHWEPRKRESRPRGIPHIRILVAHAQDDRVVDITEYVRDMRDETREITGRVKQSRIAAGSKSEHMGNRRSTPEGDEYVLRSMRRNAFRDPVLEKFVGETITGIGLVAGNSFMMRRWKVQRAR
jgi:hypothetical protein